MLSRILFMFLTAERGVTVSTTVQAPLPTSTATVTTITTTTSLLPPPTQPQQGSSDSILIQHIDELKQHVADLLQDKLALEERLDKHRDRFRDLPEADMKEILHHRMWETKSYKAHGDQKNLYEALEKSMDRPSGTLGASSASGLSQLPPPPPTPSTNHSDQSKGTDAPSSSKTAPSAEYTA
ncbi:hypothetical protein Tco_0513885 [Tanacetum coccineum]